MREIPTDTVMSLLKLSGLLHVLEGHASEYGSGIFEFVDYPEVMRFVSMIDSQAYADGKRDATLRSSFPLVT